jgi:hypothetical protein
MYPACTNSGDRIIGKSLAVVLCVHFLLSLSQQKAWLPKTPLWTWYPHMQHVFGGYIGRRSLRWMQMRTLLISSANAPSLQALSFQTLCSLPPTPHLGPHILVRWRLNQSGGWDTWSWAARPGWSSIDTENRTHQALGLSICIRCMTNSRTWPATAMPKPTMLRS